METDDLILLLSGGATAVRRLPSPGRRMVIWLAASIASTSIVLAIHGLGDGPVMRIDVRFVVEEVALLATALTAGVAALSSIIPGRDRRLALLPLIPLSFWLASLGEGCVGDWMRLGVEGLQVRADWDCARTAIVLCIVPAAAMVAMLQRGVPLVPGVSLALGALAVAAMANAALRPFHLGDVSVMVLVWHAGAAAFVVLVANCLGRLVLNWRSIIPGVTHGNGADARR